VTINPKRLPANCLYWGGQEKAKKKGGKDDIITENQCVRIMEMATEI